MINFFKIFIYILVLSASGVTAQNNVTSPHGDKLKIACESCHTTSGWNDVPRFKFNHDQVGYPLLGEHKFAECSSCHKSLIFSEVGIGCADCHTDIHKSELGNQCESCHRPQNWENRRQVFEQHNQTNFPLIGVHANLDCESCHINEQQRQFANLSVECQSCHIADYMGTLSPSHEKAGFDLDCQKCHLPGATAWVPASFDHANTGFPLVGAHTSVDCAGCHTSGYTRQLPTDCWSCHEPDFTSVDDPNHITNNFDHECTICHNSSVWLPADFNHNNTKFPLTGSHISVNCLECHSSGFENTPTDCFACHEQVYSNTTDPSHQAANFPDKCEDCHSTTAWTPANWDHDSQYFPIYSGEHREEWNVCADCHLNTNDYKQFECIDCHEHNQTDMDNDHSEVNDYTWESQACYTCHPDGRTND